MSLAANGHDGTPIGSPTRDPLTAFYAGGAPLGARPMVTQRASRRIGHRQAVVIWIAHWLGIPKQRLAERYDVDRRRIYEIIEFRRHPASYDHARRLFAALFPGRIASTRFESHRRTGRWTIPGQLDLFG